MNFTMNLLWLRVIKTAIAIAFLAAGFKTVVCAQDATSAQIDELVKTEMKLQRIPGLSLAVVKDGQIVLAKGYGLANVEHQVPAKAETIFQSGSMGKQFTAMAVMMLVEAGKVSLSDPITKYFPDSPATWKNITVRHLLTHTAGTTDYPRDFDFRRDYTEDELLKRAQQVPLAFQPGEKWAYSNLGYVLLGILIHKASGQFYGDYLQERVFRPLGMTTARIISEADIVPNRAAGYQLLQGQLKNQNWVSPTLNTTADGALYLTVFDVAKWDAALYTEKLVKKESLVAMWTPVKLNNGKSEKYGFGWAVSDVRGHRLIDHGGTWQGFKSYIARYVDDKLTVIVFANLRQANPSRIAQKVAGIYHADLAPPVAEAIADKEPAVTARAKEIVRKATEGSLDASLFTPEAWPQISRGAADASAFLKNYGPLSNIELLAATEQNGNRVYRYRLKYQDGNVVFGMTLKPDGKIVRLNINPE
ncbi:MAG TPA: serine hydrolase [Pyrinomonadaceae bacterium]|nr:serine hydrolase [Pyrinomonadaceae bacterium]